MTEQQALALYPRLVADSIALLARIDNITTDDFAKGGEREQRERLRSTLNELGFEV